MDGKDTEDDAAECDTSFFASYLQGEWRKFKTEFWDEEIWYLFILIFVLPLIGMCLAGWKLAVLFAVVGIASCICYCIVAVFLALFGQVLLWAMQAIVWLLFEDDSKSKT